MPTLPVILRRGVFAGGFSFIEIIVVIAIFLLMSTVGFQSFSLFKQNADLDAAADMGVSLLSQARSKTVAAEGGSRYGIHFEQDSLTLFTGASYVPGASGNEKFVLPTTIEMSAISVSGGGSDVVFKKLTGETDNDGTITFRLKSDGSRTRTVLVLATGLASIQE
ncbi:MAG: type II secretion system protein [Patescibacteria group bacterium]